MKIAQIVTKESYRFIGDGLQPLDEAETTAFEAELGRVATDFDALVANRPKFEPNLPLLRRDLDFFLPISVGEYALTGFDKPRSVLIWPSRTFRSEQQAGQNRRTDLILGAYVMTDSFPRTPKYLGGLDIFTDFRPIKGTQHELAEFAELLDEVADIVRPPQVTSAELPSASFPKE